MITFATDESRKIRNDGIYLAKRLSACTRIITVRKRAPAHLKKAIGVRSNVKRIINQNVEE